jgi:prepilin-type N-terminal cleavage/methylation domain-containing protein
MVLYSCLTRRPGLRPPRRSLIRGFSLLEVVLVLFVLGLLAAALAPSVRDLLATGRRNAEVKSLDQLADTITASFQSTDLTNLNLAALPGTIGATDVATNFSTATNTGYVMTNAADWFAKVARSRGITPQVGVAPSPAAQPELCRIACNGIGNPRYLFAAPSEPGRQRFLIVSLVAPSGGLVLPPYEANTAWFDAIWSNDWENRSGGLPAYWSGRISAVQASAWTTGGGGTTQVYQLCVRRITLPKYQFTVNNNHATDSAWLSFNHTAPAFTAPANSGASTTPEILGGRLIILNRGPSWPGVEALRFHLSGNDAVTLQ